MYYKELDITELGKLKDCIEELAVYHNSVSIYHSGMYPSKSVLNTIVQFREMVEQGASKIFGCIDEEAVIGFCKIDLHNNYGKLDYLFVDKRYRKKGIGRALMDWAMEEFNRYGIRRIEVKVIEGNPAIHLYEKYGFQMNAHIMWKIRK